MVAENVILFAAHPEVSGNATVEQIVSNNRLHVGCGSKTGAASSKQVVTGRNRHCNVERLIL